MFETLEAIVALFGLALVIPYFSGKLVWKREYDRELGEAALKKSGVVLPTPKDYLAEYHRDPEAFTRETIEWKPGDGFNDTSERVWQRAEHHAWLERTGYRRWLEGLVDQRRKLGRPLNRKELVTEIESELARNPDARQWFDGRSAGGGLSDRSVF